MAVVEGERAAGMRHGVDLLELDGDDAREPVRVAVADDAAALHDVVVFAANQRRSARTLRRRAPAVVGVQQDAGTSPPMSPMAALTFRTSSGSGHARSGRNATFSSARLASTPSTSAHVLWRSCRRG
jgi:hypothetical protein